MQNKLIDAYIERLITESTPDKPIWNIELLLDKNKKPHWNYIDGCMTNSLLEIYKETKEQKYFDFVEKFIDYYVSEDGSVLGFSVEKYNIDDVKEGTILFPLYEMTKKEKYRKAIELIYSQLKTHPRTKEGNFWHKKIYPNQIWLDGLYMGQPFYMLYETKYNGMKNYNDILNQFKNVRKLMFDESKKLYYHGYDSSKEMFWADKKTGLSKNFWLRAIGWFIVSVADCADYMDKQMYDEFNFFKELLKEAVDGLLQYQDQETKMFYQVVDQVQREGNYLETSGSAMVSYAILKGVRLGMLPERYQKIGLDIFNGIVDKYLTTNEQGELNLGGICLVAGLGPENNLRRDGTYEYYISEPVVENEAKGVGPLIMAYTEILKIK